MLEKARFSFLASSLLLMRGSHALTCGEVKQFYQDSECCDAEVSQDVVNTCSLTTPNYGFPKCFSTFKDLSTQYARNETYDYLPSTEGYIYRPYLTSDAFDCVNVPTQTWLGVPHSSPLTTLVLSVSGHDNPAGFPASMHQKMIIGLTGSWNREPGTQTGGQFDMVDLVSEGQTIRAANVDNFWMPNPSDDRSGIMELEMNHWMRPSDIKQHADGRVYAAAKSPAPIDGFFAVTYDMDSTAFDAVGSNRVENVYVDSANSYMSGKSKITLHQLSGDPCARRLALTSKYAIVTHNERFCSYNMSSSSYPSGYDEATDFGVNGKPGTGFYSAIKAYELADGDLGYVTASYFVKGLYTVEGVAVSDGTLFITTSDPCSSFLGARTLKIENIDTFLDNHFSDSTTYPAIEVTDNTLPNGALYLVGLHPRLKTWHPFVQISVTEDKKYILHQHGNNCNQGCEGKIYAMKISDGSLWEFANGFRNPVYTYPINGHVIVLDMLSDMGINMPEEFGEGQDGPNDRILAVPYVEPSIPLTFTITDDMDNKLANNGTNCSAVIAEFGCDGFWTWGEFEFFGDPSKLYVKDECQVSCNSSLSVRADQEDCAY